MGTVHFFSPFFRFGYEMLLLIEFFCWIGLDLIRFCFGFLDSLSKRFFVKFINMQKLPTVFCFLKLLTVDRILLWPLLKNKRLYSLSLMLSSQIIISGSYKNKNYHLWFLQKQNSRFCHCFFYSLAWTTKKRRRRGDGVTSQASTTVGL